MSSIFDSAVIASEDLFSSLTDLQKKQAKAAGIIAASIANKRKLRGLSQKELADELNVTQGMISKWESSEYNFSIDKLLEIFESLGISLDMNIDGKSASLMPELYSTDELLGYQRPVLSLIKVTEENDEIPEAS